MYRTLTGCLLVFAAMALSVCGTTAAVLQPLGGCSATVSSFSFSIFSPLTHTGRFAQGYVSFNCTSAVADVTLSSGNSGQFRIRRMTADGRPGDGISYNVFLDANHTQVFGDGTGGSSVYVPGPNVSKGGFPIYGEISDSQTALRVATYSDVASIAVNLTP